MAGKDTRNRQARRGSRRAHRELAEVATKVAHAAVEGDAGERCPEAPFLPGQCAVGEVPEPVMPLAATTPAPPLLPPVLPPAALQPPAALPTIDEEKRLGAAASKKASAAEGPARSPAHAVLTKVPTPVRSPKAMDLPNDTTPRSQGGGPVDSSRFSMPSPARGPEPWGLQAPAASVAAKGGYREWLQARGQQAMQRSLLQGSSPANRTQASVPPPAHPPSAPAPCPGAVSGVLSSLGAPPAAPAAPPQPQMVTWGVAGDLQMQQWFGAPNVEMSPMGGQQAPLGFGGCGQQSLVLPGCGQQSPLAFSSACQQSAGAPMSGQQSPMAYSACGQQASLPFTGGNCQQGMATPIASQQSPIAFGGICQQNIGVPSGQQTPKECNQSELMAALMPGSLSGMDGEQLAAQLRAAAPCCYDD